MNVKVIYFTRTGNSKRIAEKIAEKLSCKTIQLTDYVDWSGPLGYAKAIYYIIAKKIIEFKLDSPIAEDDELIVVTPLWASMPCPTVAEFLKSVQRDRVHLVTSAGASEMKQTDGYRSVQAITTQKKNEDDVIAAFVAGISK